MFVETISPAEAAKRLSDPLVHFAGHDDDAASEPSTSQSSNGGTPSEGGGEGFVQCSFRRSGASALIQKKRRGEREEAERRAVLY